MEDLDKKEIRLLQLRLNGTSLRQNLGLRMNDQQVFLLQFPYKKWGTIILKLPFEIVVGMGVNSHLSIPDSWQTLTGTTFSELNDWLICELLGFSVSMVLGYASPSVWTFTPMCSSLAGFTLHFKTQFNCYFAMKPILSLIRQNQMLPYFLFLELWTGVYKNTAQCLPQCVVSIQKAATESSFIDLSSSQQNIWHTTCITYLLKH